MPGVLPGAPTATLSTARAVPASATRMPQTGSVAHRYPHTAALRFRSAKSELFMSSFAAVRSVLALR
jgi:hypothetical protein